MKRAITLSLLSLLLTLIALIAALYSALQTQYATPIINSLLPHWHRAPSSVESARYLPPFQFQLSGVHYKEQDIYIPEVQFWLNETPWQNGQWVVDSLLIKEANLSSLATLTPLVNDIKLHQLAFQHTDFSGDRWSLRGVNAQIQAPTWSTPEQLIPYGAIQLSANQFYINNQAFDKVLIDMDYAPENSTAYGLSFDWQNASFTGQAEQFESGWSLVNVTIKTLHVTKKTLETFTNTFSLLPIKIEHINSLDLIGAHFALPNLTIDNLNLSSENLALSSSIWQQKGYVSFDADVVDYQGLRLIDITAKADLQTGKIHLSELNTNFNDGNINFSGSVSPHSIDAQHFTVSGVKWLDQTHQQTQKVLSWLSSLDSLTLNKLDVNNAQLIQLQRFPYWQVSGLNVEGEQLTLIKKGKPFIWQGNLAISANSASVGELRSSQPIVSVYSNHGHASLERLFIPLENGYLNVSGAWNRSSISQPWSLEMHGSGLPIAPIFTSLDSSWHLDGNAEIEGQVQGLAGDTAMLSHSLTGAFTLGFNQVNLQLKPTHNMSLDDDIWTLNADRGRIDISNVSEGLGQTVASHIDLLYPEKATLILQKKHGCAIQLVDLISQTYIEQDACE